MGDVFKEQLVKVKKTGKDTLLQALIVIATVFLVVAAFIFGGAFIGPLLILAILWGAWFLLCRLKKEYEYSLTNSELDIDVIYNKEKRKRMMTLDMKKIHVMASIKDERKKEEIERAQKVLDFSDGQGTQDTYAVVCEKEGNVVRVLITPNEQMLTLMHKQAPHKVFKPRI